MVPLTKRLHNGRKVTALSSRPKASVDKRNIFIKVKSENFESLPCSINSDLVKFIINPVGSDCPTRSFSVDLQCYSILSVHKAMAVIVILFINHFVF